MSQNDFNIANQGFPATRADINSALQALASNSAGTTAPSTTYAYQFWYDETNELLKMRNSDNDAWITLAAFDQTNDEWEVRSAVIQAVDAAGVTIKTDDGTARVTVDDNGNVGIGTSSPSNFSGYTTLDVVNASNGGAILARGSTVEARFVADDATGTVQVKAQSSHPLTFATSGTERMRIDSSGSVGIGTSSPTADGLHIYEASQPDLFMGNSDDNDGFRITYNSTDTVIGNWSNTPLRLITNGSERARIDSSGNLLIGTTTTPTNSGAVFEGGTDPILNIGGTSTSATGRMRFRNPNGIVGSITTSGSSTAYNTTSDYRLKENLTALDGASDRLAQIPVHRFNFIADPNTTVDGFLAHEVQVIVPEAVTGEKDAMRLEQYVVEPALGEVYTPAQPAKYDEDGVELTPATDEVIHSTNVERPAELLDGQQWRETTPAVMGEREVPDYQGIDQSKLVPLLTAALQEALQKIDALEARVTALGG